VTEPACTPGPACCPQVFPRANPLALHEVQLADAIVYGMGSLYTSVCPCVCLDGMGEAIAARDVPKVGSAHGHELMLPCTACKHSLLTHKQPPVMHTPL
jgi:hypothetical protein